ncbi:hypothetical protein BJ742DRAFT_251403 [Cladochytrium replicatum]|nr:hypothetical protein BJ742DRAFT_251403 [Cladochytrium replicatum]
MYMSAIATFARLIVATLKEQQFSVWVDFEQMIGNVYEQMADGIAGSRVFLPIISVNYETRVNCRKELCYAADMKRPMVPLRLVKWGQTPLCDLLTTAMVSIDVTGVRGGLESYHPTKK